MHSKTPPPQTIAAETRAGVISEVTRAPMAESVNQPLTGDYDTWAGWPGKYSQSIGFESTSSTNGIIGKDLVVYDSWGTDWGKEYFFGFEKFKDTATRTDQTVDNSVANTSTRTITSSGAKNPYVLTLGGGLKRKIHQGK